MTMKKRIFLSNTAMVLLSLLILFGMGGLCVSLFKEEFMNVIEQNAKLSDDTYAVQTILMDEQKNPDTWESLSKKIAKYHFELYVSDEQQKQQYSNVRHSEWECIEELEEDTAPAKKMNLYSMENVTIAKCTIRKNAINYNVYATYYPGELSLWGMDRGMFEMFIIVFIISGVIVIGGLLLCCQIFTKIMIKRIMRPVDELNLAAQRINEGNLLELIQYKEKDEFGEVCNTFNSMQEHLKSGMEKNEKYEKARTEMISGISHDLRTPLTSIKGFVKGLLDGVANTPEKQRQYLEITYQKSCDMEVLLQKLFFFSKLETGNMPFFPQKIDLGQWLETYIERKKAEGLTQNYLLVYNKEEQEYPVNIDIEQMKRVFDNLVENSRKYANATELQITISIRQKLNKVCVAIKDNGCGIEKEKLPYVFDQFYRGDESRNSGNDGSGLGLYVCKYIVEAYQGRIQASSQNGFTVEIELPIDR